MNNLMNFAMQKLLSNPNIKNQQLAQELLKVMQSGDTKRGEELAKQLCQTYQTTPEEALKNAKRFFKL